MPDIHFLNTTTGNMLLRTPDEAEPLFLSDTGELRIGDNATAGALSLNVQSTYIFARLAATQTYTHDGTWQNTGLTVTAPGVLGGLETFLWTARLNPRPWLPQAPPRASDAEIAFRLFNDTTGVPYLTTCSAMMAIPTVAENTWRRPQQQAQGLLTATDGDVIRLQMNPGTLPYNAGSLNAGARLMLWAVS